MKVICIKQHSESILIIGKIYEVNNIDTCECGFISFDIGLRHSPGTMNCCCNKKTYTIIYWIGSKLFTSIEEKGEMFIEEFLIKINTKPEV